jgi:teichuronic acid exporter
MNLGESVRKGVKWLLLGSTGGQILQFAFGILLARLLVPADFGMIVTIQIFTGFVAMFATGGMGQSLIRAKEATEDDFAAVFTLQLALGIVVYSGFFVCAPWLARYLENPRYEDLLRVSALSFILRPFTFVRIAWLNRAMNFRKRATVDLTAGALTGVSSILLAAIGLGVWSLTLSGLFGALVSSVLYFFATPLRVRLRFDTAIARRHTGYGFKITANDFLDYLRDESVNLMLSKMAGPAVLGLFNKASSLARMPNRLVTPPTGQTVFRAMSKVQDDLDQTKYIFYRTITLLSVYVLPCLVGLWWIAEPFIQVVYGPKWLPAAEPMKILVVGAAFRVINNPCGVLLAAQNRLLQEMIGQTLGVILTLIACLFGLSWGMHGVAWALVASSIFYAAYNYALVLRTIRTRPVDLLRAIAPALFLNAAMFAVLAIVHHLAGDLRSSIPALYLCVMTLSGFFAYACAFLFLPIPALRSEATRWRNAIRRGAGLVAKTLL